MGAPGEDENQVSWESRAASAVARLAWPICVSTLGYASMSLVDTLFVGQLGTEALAGVGLAAVTSFAMLVFPKGLLRAVKVLVSQAEGAGDRARGRRFWAAGLFLALVLGGLVVAIGQLVASALPGWQAGAAGQLGASYLAVRVLGAPFWLCTQALSEGRYALGEARAPMWAALAANVTNIALDALFIFGLDAGVEGAAWASVVAQGVEVLILTLLCRRMVLCRFARDHVLALFAVGIPTAMQYLVEFGAFVVLTVLVAGMSDRDMAAHQAAIHVLHFSFLPALAIGEAASVLAGRAMGAGRADLVPVVAGAGAKLVALYTALCTGLTLLFAQTIARWFSEDPEVWAIAMGLLHVSAVFLVVDGLMVIARGVLRGAGDNRYPAVLSVAVAWITTPPLCWFLGVHLGWGARGAWWGLALEVFLSAALLWWRLLSGHWEGAARRTRARALR